MMAKPYRAARAKGTGLARKTARDFYHQPADADDAAIFHLGEKSAPMGMIADELGHAGPSLQFGQIVTYRTAAE